MGIHYARSVRNGYLEHETFLGAVIGWNWHCCLFSFRIKFRQDNLELDRLALWERIRRSDHRLGGERFGKMWYRIPLFP